MFTNHFAIEYQLDIILSKYTLTKHEQIFSIVLQIQKNYDPSSQQTAAQQIKNKIKQLVKKIMLGNNKPQY